MRNLFKINVENATWILISNIHFNEIFQKPKYNSFFASLLMIKKDKSNKYWWIQKEAKTFACLIILYVLSHLSWAGKKVKKIAKKFTYIANKHTLRQNYLWRMKIFLTSEFWEFAIWNLNPKNLLHNFFQNHFFKIPFDCTCTCFLT